MNNRVSVLSTVLLDQQLIDKAAVQGIAVDTISFIQVEAIKDKELNEEIAELSTLPITAVFTSANAVRAISSALKAGSAGWDIYCIGQATKDAVFEYFDTEVIAGVANDAAELAGIIIDDDLSEVVFFCGDKRMNTLPDLLREADVTVYEITVYGTVETPHLAVKSYDGILFFSPSGVNSFFSINTIGKHTVLFAIGSTTANAIHQQTDNKVMICAVPSKDNMIEEAILYFNRQTAA